MNIDGKVFKRAEERYVREKHARELDRARRLDETMRKIPRIAEIDGELKRLGMKIVEVYFDGADVEARIDAIKRSSNRLVAERRQLLVKNGYPEDWFDDKNLCPVCGDTGYVNSHACACLLSVYKKEQEIELADLFNLAPGGLDIDLNAYSDAADDKLGMSPRTYVKNVVTLVKTFAQKLGNGGQNLFLRGDGRADKLPFAAHIAKSAIDKGLFTVYTPAFSFFRTLEDERFGRDEEARSETERFYKCDLLIIDELGTEQTTAYAAAVLLNIISKRFADKKLTVITSDISVDDIAVRYSPQTAFRIGESYTNVFIPRAGA